MLLARQYAKTPDVERTWLKIAAFVGRYSSTGVLEALGLPRLTGRQLLIYAEELSTIVEEENAASRSPSRHDGSDD